MEPHEHLYSLAVGQERILPSVIEHCGITENFQYARKLRFDLLTNYSTEILPVRNQSAPVVVTVGFYLIMLQQLNIKQQHMIANSYLKISWQDEFLQWNPAEYGGIEELFLFQHEVWKPDVMLENTARPHRDLGTNHTLVSVMYTGVVHWTPGLISETSCIVDITKYPFDIQICDVRFLAWMRTNWTVSVVPETAAVNVDDLMPNGEWDITSTSAQETHYPSTYRKGAEHRGVSFVLHLYRKRFFHIPATIIPVMLLSTLKCLVFILPPDCGERMGVITTLLLEFTIYLSIVTDTVPATSDHICIFTIYLAVLLGLSTTSVVCAGVVLNVHFRDPDQPIPQCLISFFGRMYQGEDETDSRKGRPVVLGRKLTMQHDHMERERNGRHSRQSVPPVPPNGPAQPKKTPQVITEIQNDTREGMATTKAADNANNIANKDAPEQVGYPGTKKDNTQETENETAPSSVACSDAEGEVHAGPHVSKDGLAQTRPDYRRSLIAAFTEEIRKLVQQVKKKKKSGRVIGWREIASAMDRFFFWVFLFATTFVNIAVMFLWLN